MIPVSKPFLPPIDEYEGYLKGIWKRQWLTNMGPLANDLELKLKKELQLDHLLYVTNGTVAIQLSIKALGITGDVITTPFSFIATTSSIVWENCNPVFVDIDSDSLNIDPKKIEAAITNNTQAILATHVYGNPCDVNAIQKIADKHKLKVIYDAAHAFGVNLKGKSIFEFGDVSTCSLHATKLYHSIEGGLVVSKFSQFIKKIAHMRNFGFLTAESFCELGINGKNSEFHAAMGLANLRYISQIHAKRKRLTERYETNLLNFKGTFPKWNEDASKNYAYFPIVFNTETDLLKVSDKLKVNDIQARRYFYPSLASQLPYLPSVNMMITEDISRRVLCLPLYYDLSIEEVDLICRIILRIQNSD